MTVSAPVIVPARVAAVRDRQRVVLIAHGSPDPRHARGIGRLADRMRALLDCDVTAAFLEHDTPSAGDALDTPAARSTQGGHTTVVPLLFTAGYHWRNDIPVLLGHNGSSVTLVAPPRPADFASVVAGLAGPVRDDVVIASAGSSRPEIGPRFAALADELRGSHGIGRVSIALSVSAVDEHAGPNSVVVPFLSADGFFGDRIRAAAAARGARTTEVVGDTPAFAEALADALP